MIKFVCASCGERLSVPDQNGGRKGVCPTCGAINRIPLKGFAETKPQVPTIARPDGSLRASSAPAGPAPIVRGALSMAALSGRIDDPEPAADVSSPVDSPPANLPTGTDDLSIAPDADEAPQSLNDHGGRLAGDAPDLIVEDEPLSELPPAAHVPANGDSLKVEPPAPADNNSTPAAPASFGLFGLPAPAQATPKEKPVQHSFAFLAQAAPPAPVVDDDAPAPLDGAERRLPKPVKMFLLAIVVLAIVAGIYCALYYGMHALLNMLNGG